MPGDTVTKEGMDKVKVICLTPVRNEAWILDKFLRCTSLWADHIIIADQMSTDGSREIAKKFSKVTLINNASNTFNEPERQKLLIDEARRISGRLLLVTLDADEIFTPNVLSSPEWKTILASPPGSIFKFQWANLQPDMRSMWLAGHFAWGYMDDGFEHSSQSKIHTGRIPLPSSHNVIVLNQIKVIHFQYTSWIRMQSKHRWYQCFEKVNVFNRSELDLFRTYHHMYGLSQSQTKAIPLDWIQGYNDLGIDITSIIVESRNYFDEQVLALLEHHGAHTFKKLSIWDLDWVEKAKVYGRTNLDVYKDPRTRWDRYIHRYLVKTQPKCNKLIFRLIDLFIKSVFRY